MAVAAAVAGVKWAEQVGERITALAEPRLPAVSLTDACLSLSSVTVAFARHAHCIR